jgi:hypothetical protein
MFCQACETKEKQTSDIPLFTTDPLVSLTVCKAH